MANADWLSKSGPTEILVCILQSCDDFQQLISLASACKRLRDTYLANVPVILYPIAERIIPACYEALLAARATEIAKDALLQSKLPPEDLDMAHLTAVPARTLQLSELLAIRKLHVLVCRVEQGYLDADAWELDDGWDGYGLDEDGVFRDLPNSEDWARHSREHFHRAMYRVLLAGPILARQYNEPFSFKGVLGRPSPDVPANLKRVLKLRANAIESRGLFEPDLAYLERNVLFDQRATVSVRGQDGVLGPLADWLIGSIKTSTTNERLLKAGLRQVPGPDYYMDEELARQNLDMLLEDFTGGSQADAQVALTEIIRMLVIYEHLIKLLGSPAQADDSVAAEDGNHDQSCSQSTSVVLLGSYQIEEITMSGKLSRRPLIGRWPVLPVGQGEACGVPEALGQIDIRRLLNFLYDYSGRPNCVGHAKTPRPHLLLFAFVLRKYFNLQFNSETLAFSGAPYRDWDEFLTDGSIFCNHEWSGSLECLSRFDSSANYTYNGRTIV